MSGENKKLLYILIGSGSKPLSGYSDQTGDFILLCESQLERCQKNQSASITSEHFKIFYENIDNITYLLMTTPEYPIAAAVSCIESLKKEFSDDLHGRNFSTLDNYGLNNEMKQKIKMKFEYYNKNTEIVSENLESLRDAISQYHQEVLSAAKELDERSKNLEELQSTAQGLENGSYNYAKAAFRVKKKECCKSVWTKVAIAAIILIIIAIILAVTLS